MVPSPNNLRTRPVPTMMMVGVLLLLSSHSSQAQAPQDPTGVALINQGLTLLNGGTALSDVTLQANVTYTAGSDVETGAATLQALGDGNSLVVLNLSDGDRQYIHNNQGSLPAGAWIGTDGSVNLYGLQNCWNDAAWFFPGLILTSLPGNPQVGLVNLGEGLWNGSLVNHIQIYQSVSNQPAGMALLIQAFSTEDVYLDPTSQLPVAIDFTTHPDDNMGSNIAAEIQFNSYQTVNGMSVPFNVVELVNGSVSLNLTVTNVTVNSGLSPSLFIIP